MIAMLRCARARDVRLWIASSGPVLPARGRHPSCVGRSIVTSTLLVRSGSRHLILPEMGTATPALIFFSLSPLINLPQRPCLDEESAGEKQPSR
jgi:hypothetical protein